MKSILKTLLCLIIFVSCNPCEKYKNEVYHKEAYEYQFDSTGMKGVKLMVKRYNEPTMDTLDYESYRLVYGVVFSDTSHLIRIENNHSNYRYIHKKLLRNKYEPPTVFETIEKKLLPEEWEKFIDILYQNHYWTMPKEIDRLGLDGGVWTIEGRRPDAEICGKRSYHLVSRWSPEEGEFQNLCDKFDEIMELNDTQK